LHLGSEPARQRLEPRSQPVFVRAATPPESRHHVHRHVHSHGVSPLDLSRDDDEAKAAAASPPSWSYSGSKRDRKTQVS
jgi:hypothetical protein